MTAKTVANYGIQAAAAHNIVIHPKLAMGNCPSCGALPGSVHFYACTVERCSVCGGAHTTCRTLCRFHDPRFARWNGFMPGAAECCALGLVKDDGSPDLDAVYTLALHILLFIKPN